MLHCAEKSEESNTEGKEPLAESKSRMPCKLEEQHEEMDMQNNILVYLYHFNVHNISLICMTINCP